MADENHRAGFTVTDRRGQDHTEPAPATEPGPAEGTRADEPLLEIDFATFIMSLASSALVHLGELAPPGATEAHVNLPLAKQTIDILGMLSDKTRGNLTSDEQKLLEHLLYDLRLKFVEARKDAR